MRAWPIAAVLLLAACGTNQAFGPRGGVPGVDVAEAALHGGSPQIALRIDEAILAKDPHNVPVLLNRGDAQTALQRFDAAMKSYAAALEADPGSVPARIGLGRLRLRVDPAAAESLFAEVLQREPHNTVALNDLGIARDLLGRHQDAQAAYRQAIGIDATMTGAQVNLALSLAMDGRAGDAAPMLRPLASDPGAPRKLRHDLAAVLAMAGDRGEAQRILARDLPPEEVDRALAIFVAASTSSGAARLTDTAPAASPVPVTPVSAMPVSATSAPTTPVSATPVPAAGASTQDAQAGGLATGGRMVELSSQASSAAAEAAWMQLRQQMPDLLAERQPILLRSESAGQVFWHVRAGGFAGPQDAASFCHAVEARGGTCAVTGS